MITILWVLIALNTLAVLTFIGAYFVLNRGRRVDYQEKGWTFILSALGLLLILAAVIPLQLFHSTGSLLLSTFFAALPLAIFIYQKLPSFEKTKTFAQAYYKDKNQRSIAAAIETNDILLLKQLIVGQDLSVTGKRIWDEEGLNYLQFAIRLRANPNYHPVDDKGNSAIIRLLLESGANPSTALAQAAESLPASMIAVFLDAGADPNVNAYRKPNPLLFDVIGEDAGKNDIAILLIQRGAGINVISDVKLTPVMHAASHAGTNPRRTDAWRVVRYLLETAHADYNYTNPKGVSLAGIIQHIRTEAAENKITMPADFSAVAAWLFQHGVDTTPGFVK